MDRTEVHIPPDLLIVAGVPGGAGLHAANGAIVEDDCDVFIGGNNINIPYINPPDPIIPGDAPHAVQDDINSNDVVPEGNAVQANNNINVNNVVPSNAIPGIGNHTNDGEVTEQDIETQRVPINGMEEVTGRIRRDFDAKGSGVSFIEFQALLSRILIRSNPTRPPICLLEGAKQFAIMFDDHEDLAQECIFLFMPPYMHEIMFQAVRAIGATDVEDDMYIGEEEDDDDDDEDSDDDDGIVSSNPILAQIIAQVNGDFDD
jgi:hypothetical protein